jgi:hypothetical protein
VRGEASRNVAGTAFLGVWGGAKNTLQPTDSMNAHSSGGRTRGYGAPPEPGRGASVVGGEQHSVGSGCKKEFGPVFLFVFGEVIRPIVVHIRRLDNSRRECGGRGCRKKKWFDVS